MNTLQRFVLAPTLLMPLVGGLASDLQVPAGSDVKLGSRVFKWEDLVVKPTNVGERRDVANQPTATISRFECHISTLNPGQVSHPPHKHPQEEFIILKDGMLDVAINGKTQRVGPNSMFFFAANDLHNVKNVGDRPATYLVFNVTTAATRNAPAQGAAEANLPGKLPSSVFDWDKLAVKTTATGELREIANSPTVTCAKFDVHATTLKPGMAPHAAHHHPEEELLVLLKGEMETTINGKTDRAGPGSIFLFASNDEHGIRNPGTLPATYYIIHVVTEATPKVAANQ
jgi:quercetin dioxygenase-like cupin family protein